MNEKTRRAAIIVAAILGSLALLYVGGLFSQLMTNYQIWMDSGGMWGGAQIASPDWNPFICFVKAFTWNGLKGMALLLAVIAGIYLYVKFHDKFTGEVRDPRGFTISKTGTYGTAEWMSEKEMKEVLELTTPSKAEGNILGEYKGQLVCLPKDTRLNRHTAIFGASGTMKSRAVIRNALFQSIKRGESVIISDPKSEMYNDTSQLFRNNGYEVKVFNLVDPMHSDTWNCMSDMGQDSLMAQMLTNIVIGNTSSGKGDHFWDNGETNLLKALVLYVALDDSRTSDEKNLSAVYRLITDISEKSLFEMFQSLPNDHPGIAAFNLFSQSSETVRAGIKQGLGTRLQVLQNKAVTRLISGNEIDLTAPGKRKCAYYIILPVKKTGVSTAPAGAFRSATAP